MRLPLQSTNHRMVDTGSHLVGSCSSTTLPRNRLKATFRTLLTKMEPIGLLSQNTTATYSGPELHLTRILPQCFPLAGQSSLTNSSLSNSLRKCLLCHLPSMPIWLLVQMVPYGLLMLGMLAASIRRQNSGLTMMHETM